MNILVALFGKLSEDFVSGNDPGSIGISREFS
jgi:hypothetical protein